MRRVISKVTGIDDGEGADRARLWCEEGYGTRV